MTRIGSIVAIRRLTGLATAAALLTVTAACSGPGVAPVLVRPASNSTSAVDAGQRLVLRFDHAVVPATLADTAAGREFTALLPLTLELRDPMGQAKSGHLPVRIESAGAALVRDPDAGGIYYVIASQTLAVFYDDLGQNVPPPGLIRLGAVDGDLTTIAEAGNRIRVRVDLVDPTSS